MNELVNKILQDKLQYDRDFTKEADLIMTLMITNEKENKTYVVDMIQIILMKHFELVSFIDCLEIYNEVKELIEKYSA